MSMNQTVFSPTPETTHAWGQRLARVCERGDLLLLRGELGSGKTCLVRGIAVGLGVDSRHVRSPTFVFHHVYHGRLLVHHIDCYRLPQCAPIQFLDLDGLLAEGIIALEWPEHADLAGYMGADVTIDIIAEGRRIVIGENAPERFQNVFVGG